MKGLTLFSGIGGFDLAMERVGIDVVGMCEIDKHAQNILRKRFQNATLHDDVKKVGKEQYERGSIDVIVGGFPCQDLSIAGKRAGLAGERSGLWFEFARIIDELEPSWVVIENVPGLLSSNKGADFAVILQWLVQRGYGVCWRVLDAQYFGVPQRRRRVFIVASFGNGRCAEVLFEQEGVRRNPAESRKTGQAVAGTFTVRSGKDGGGKGYLGQESLPMTLGGQQQWAYAPYDLSHVTDPINTQNRDETSPMHTLAKYNANKASVVYSIDVANTLAGGSSKAHSDMTSGQQDGNVVAFIRQRTDEYKDGATVSTVAQRDYKGPTDLISQQVGVRRLTPMECERLQGFPDGWTDGQADTQRYKQLGNAVAVPVVQWIMKRIKDNE